MHLLKSEGSLHIHNLALNPNFNNLLEEFSLTKYFGMEVQCVLWVAETKFHILFRWGSYIKGRAVAQVVRVSPRRLGFHSGPVHVRFVVAKTALEPVWYGYFKFHLSELFHQWYILIFVIILLFSVRKVGEFWENLNFRVSMGIAKISNFTCSFYTSKC